MKKVFSIAISMSIFQVLPLSAYEIIHSVSPILNLIRKNEVAAWDEYNGNYYQFNGKVKNIYSRDRLIVIESGGGYVNCFYSPRDHMNVVELRTNGPVSVKGPLEISKGNRNIYFNINKCRVLGSHSINKSIKKKDSKRDKEMDRFNRILNAE